jgi:hypothetical protein
MLVNLGGSRRRRAIHLTNLHARASHMVARDMYCASRKRSGSAKCNGPHDQHCVNENGTS